ncbi:F-box associated interaction domain [Arabidopsis thaliana x Arabidopsis arenosa]|uniref:F-box associated interaction domain n=1 Tax=Arabidopsis thaliana x Arabidopsis arenosa TaxID=1240361 RepID=A0A8T2BNF5_9BRAS|nr:F-box associated interaction domain [Arabidopsis thaliana x Arabidopsis arenosa]
MTTMSDLSVDLVGEILSRVPLTSLSAVRCTCKSWNALSKHQVFGKAEQYLGFMVMDSRVCSLRFDLQGIRNDCEDFVDPSIIGLQKSCLKIRNKAFKKNYGNGLHRKIGRSHIVEIVVPTSIKQIRELNQVEIDNVYHCDGLLLCVTKDRWRLVVWNPYLGQIRWIRAIKQFSSGDMFTLGYDHSNSSHKIMRCYYVNACPYLEIYDFKSNSWRVVEFNPPWILYSRVVPLKGNTYFFAQDLLKTENDVNAKIENYLLCFDFTAERFGPHISLPFHSYDDEAGAVTLSCVRQEQLALLYHNRETVESLEIWITNQIDPNAVSWSMFFKVDIKPLIGFPKVFEPASFFIDKEKKVAVVSEDEYLYRPNETCRYQTLYIIGEDGYFKSFKIRCSDSPELSSYAPSLVHIQTNQQGKRKSKRKNKRRKIQITS